MVDNVDIPAFKKAGEKAYEVLKIADVKKKIFEEIGKEVGRADKAVPPDPFGPSPSEGEGGSEIPPET